MQSGAFASCSTLPVVEADPFFLPLCTHMDEFAHLSISDVGGALTAGAHYHAELSANERSALSAPSGATANRCLNIDERSVQAPDFCQSPHEPQENDCKAACYRTNTYWPLKGP